jgi:hypothetical protein
MKSWIKKMLPSLFFGALFGFLFQIGFNDCRAWIAILFEVGLTVSFVIQEPEIEERKERGK